MIMGYWNGMRWEVSGRQIAYLETNGKRRRRSYRGIV